MRFLKCFFSQNSSERISVLVEVAANMETDVVALSYLLGVIVKDKVNSSDQYQVKSILKTVIELKRMNIVSRIY